MKIKVGQKIKVNVVELKEKKEKFGVIEGIYEHHILINFGAYKSSINKAEIIAGEKFFVRKNREWIKVDKENL
ncbi:TPA: hypothetical protein NJT26_000193 [Clostridium perfringens]|uniref:DUF2187 domain-containing protein n=1 Tax=Clostridium perfringens TaxID=1502 RepID=A0A2X3A600_CLOPF|nr:hypothetical protein [Clostridium perfringens]EJT6497550.1 hypothetical protein [Clostridium perfringens]MDK0900125.1 hypothetical protein [Clostridium perfringens]NGT47711.1 hypothetical protein [Clostridium perfringens]SQB57810.1 Uncharacterised protein [Clostridium perfringens]BDA34843.1 hypothetical protein CPBEC5_18510 [Clostridium perfringens]